MALNLYLQQTQRLLNDLSETNFNRFDLVEYINEARQQIAIEGQCVRKIPPNNNTVVNQEVYEYSAVNLSGLPGVSAIMAVRGVSIVWNTYRFTMQRVSFGRYQALVRTYSTTYSDVPRICTQFGQGEAGSIYIYPLPNDVYSMEWDCVCNVSPLVDDSTAEIIPSPWLVPIQYYAAYKALQMIDLEKSEKMFQQYSRFMKRGRAFSQPSQVNNWYGRA